VAVEVLVQLLVLEESVAVEQQVQVALVELQTEAVAVELLSLAALPEVLEVQV
jgi:hypothetical protein